MIGFGKALLGIELSDSLFKLVELQRKGRKVRINQMVVHPLPPKWMKNGTIAEPDELVSAIREALMGRRFRTRKVQLAINSNHTVIQQIKVPEMRKRKLRKMLQREVIPEMELPFTDPLFDFYCYGEVWEEGALQDALIVTASRSYIQSLVETIEECGLEPIGIDLVPLANLRWLRFCQEEFPRQFIVAHLTKTGVEISCFEHEVLSKTRYIPLNMTLFKEKPDCPFPDPLTPVLKEAAEIERYGKSLLTELDQELDAYSREGIFPTECVLTGEGLDFSQLQTWLAENVTFDVTIGPSIKNILSPSLQEKVSRWLGPSLSVPVGLVLEGREQAYGST